MKKGGKKYRDDEALKKESILNVLKEIPTTVCPKDDHDDRQIGVADLQHEDLKELLEKNKGRFFGGCGG